MSLHPDLVTAGNVISFGALAGSVMGIVPPIATVASLIWFCLEIWESKTVQKWVRMHRHKKRRKRRIHRAKQAVALASTTAVDAGLAAAAAKAAVQEAVDNAGPSPRS